MSHDVESKLREAGLAAKNWEETARQQCRNSEFYRGLLVGLASHLGAEAFVADDGKTHDEPIVMKIPELVEKMAAQRKSLHDALGYLLNQIEVGKFVDQNHHALVMNDGFVAARELMRSISRPSTKAP